MSDAAHVLAEVRARGIQLRAAGDRIKYSPRELLDSDPAMLDRLRALKPDLLRLLEREARCGSLDQHFSAGEVLDFPAALLAELPLPTTLVLEFGDGRRQTWAMHPARSRADRGRRDWLALCAGDRRRTVANVLAELGATLRLVRIEGAKS